MATSQDLVNADLNLATLDGVVTSNAESVPDRLGQQKLTIAEIQRRSEAAVAAAGFYPVAGSFEAGGTITERNQVLQRTTAPAAYFSWGGALPKVVPPSSTVAGTGGESVTAWTNRNDATLAGALADGTAPIGSVTAGEVSNLVEGIADGSADVGGAKAADLAKATLNVSNLKSLASIPLGERRGGVTYRAMEFNTGTGIGGHDLKWNPTKSWTSADIGLVWPDVALSAWDGTAAGLSVLYGIFTAGVGCWERVDNKIDPDSFGYVVGGVDSQNTIAMNKFRESLRVRSEKTYKTTVGGVNWNFSKLFESYGKVDAAIGRFSPLAYRTQWVGDGVQIPGASGAASSSNMSSLALSQNAYTGGNSEMIQGISRTYSATPSSGIVMDLGLYGGSGLFGYELVVRDANVAAMSTIQAAISSELIVAASDTAIYFGGGINTRSGVSRGYPLLNDSKKLQMNATLSGADLRIVSVASTAGIFAGYYFGFDADTVGSYALDTQGRHLIRIKSVDSATQLTLDDELEGSASFEAFYQGNSTTGAATIFPSALPSGYDPITRTFSFESTLGSTLDTAIFEVGDTVRQYPSTGNVLIGGQVDMERTATQRVQQDYGFVVVNNGSKAAYGYYLSGKEGGITYAFNVGHYLNNVSVARLVATLPQNETDNIAGFKHWHENQAPSVIGADGIKGSVFHRGAGGPDKSIYVNTDTGENYQPILWLSQDGYPATAMPSVTTLGWMSYSTAHGAHLTWDGSRWTVQGYRAIGTTAQRPTTIWTGFKYYDTTTSTLVVWNGSAWV